MGAPSDRKALAVELFDVTGEAVPENDPIVTGALFFSYKLGKAGRFAEKEVREAARAASLEIREAGRLAAQDIRDAGRSYAADSAEAVSKAEASSRAAAGVIDRLSSDRSQILKTVETHIAKCVKLASNRQSGPDGLRYVPAWYAVVAAVAGAVALAAAWQLGIEQGSVRAEEAAIGRSFARAVPTMDPKLRAQLMEHLRKNSG